MVCEAEKFATGSGAVQLFIVTLKVWVAEQGPAVVYVTTKDPAPEPVIFITPVLELITPLLFIVNVPPVAPVIVGVGFGSVKQKLPDAKVNAALWAEFTTIVIVSTLPQEPEIV